ncbi:MULTISPECIES: hypothetical protein [Pseudomonas]|uniref:Uncharacterized protein n=1 Tax=Pseudomonas gingeri TaxID=117681 RepID=A0A7Y8BQU5_9PSED|nr:MULTISPECIES: hypothetical protein [Pseudomonas]MPQ67762.1 hypothetical protein [Pseudomonas sp. MWU12-2323]NWB84002.1 hypothetical protein [Pseudomonas gingeri]
MTEHSTGVTLTAKGLVFEDDCGEPFLQDDAVRGLLEKVFADSGVDITAIHTQSQYKKALRHVMISSIQGPGGIEAILAMALQGVELLHQQFAGRDDFQSRLCAGALQGLLNGDPDGLAKAKRASRILASGLRPVASVSVPDDRSLRTGDSCTPSPPPRE